MLAPVTRTRSVRAAIVTWFGIVPNVWSAVVVLIWSEIAPVVKVKSVLRLDESANVTSVMFAAMPPLSTRIWPLAIVTVTNVWLPLPSSSRTFSRSIEMTFRDLREREAAAQPLAEGLEVDVRALDRDRAGGERRVADGLRRRRRVQLHLERPADADARDVHRDRRLDPAEDAGARERQDAVAVRDSDEVALVGAEPQAEVRDRDPRQRHVVAGAEGAVGADLRRSARP